MCNMDKAIKPRAEHFYEHNKTEKQVIGNCHGLLGDKTIDNLTNDRLRTIQVPLTHRKISPLKPWRAEVVQSLFYSLTRSLNVS